MPELAHDLPPEARVILAIDASTLRQADVLLDVAKEAGAQFVKLGLELSSAIGWAACSEMTRAYNIDWIADAKIDDIPNTTKGIMNNLAKLKHPPVGVTIHAKSGAESMIAAQDIAQQAGGITMMAVTHLTSIDEQETQATYGMSASGLVLNLARNSIRSGVLGLVCSPKELAVVKADIETQHSITMIPGIRPAGMDKGDQSRVMTPGEAITLGADLLVIGRPISQADDPAAAYESIVAEISESLNRESVKE